MSWALIVKKKMLNYKREEIMKKLYVILAVALAIMSLSSCGSLASMDSESAYRNGYNMGVFLRGGDSSEYLRE